jgi:CrcB protein
VLGVVAARSPRLLGTGFCGALTTFSTLQVELLDLRPWSAAAYATASLSAGYAALLLGRRV